MLVLVLVLLLVLLVLLVLLLLLLQTTFVASWRLSYSNFWYSRLGYG